MSVPDVDWNNIREAAEYINRWAQETFPGREPSGSLSKLVLEEIPELLQHKKLRGTEDIGLELADCFILLLDLSVIWGVDLAQALMEKMEINACRFWERDKETGLWSHAVPHLLGLESPDPLAVVEPREWPKSCGALASTIDPDDSEGGIP